MKDKCSVKGCNQESALLYLGRSLCSKHWDKDTVAFPHGSANRCVSFGQAKPYSTHKPSNHYAKR